MDGQKLSGWHGIAMARMGHHKPGKEPRPVTPEALGRAEQAIGRARVYMMECRAEEGRALCRTPTWQRWCRTFKADVERLEALKREMGVRGFDLRME